ncbi:hypothetical protein Naga_100382g3 [Nannochloropsis gaditana]|uniref:Uncharacterized protein n=1 Tax=Nannochloropsis gaditana TaxID=72520 RepID=W7TJJ8_9STRA|nr:hypothetical protein Naga_100382g3 [Nannochloropsis gaditana]
METQALEEELLTKGQTSGASASEEEEGDGKGQSLLGTILERVDRPRMAEQFLDAFHAVQRRGKIHREGMVGMLRHWKKLSDLAGEDLTLGIGAAIANALKVEAWELQYRGGDTVKRSESWTGDSSLGIIHTPNSFQGRLSSKRFPTTVEEGPMGLLLEEELAAVEAGAARLKASPLFRERDDGYTGLLLIEVDRTEDRVIVASNQAYLDVFLGPGFLLSEGLARGCLEPFLFAAFVAHSDRDTWFRMNLEALCSPRFRPERGRRRDGVPRRERLLYSEFLKIFSRDGHVRLYWARLAQLEVSMREGEEEKMHFLLWMEPVPASRYITDRPEKTTQSKTTLFRQRPSAETGSLSREAREVCASVGEGEELGWRPLKLQDFSETEEKGDGASSGCGERQQVALQKRSPPSLFFPALASVPLPPGTSLPSLPSSWTVNTDQTRAGPPPGFLSPSGFPTPPFLFRSYSPSHPSSRYPLDSPAFPISSTLPDMFEIKSDFIKGLLPADPKTGLAGKSHGESTVTNPVVDVKCKHITKREMQRKKSKISCARNEGKAQGVFQVTAEPKHSPKHHKEQQQQERQLQQQQQQQQQEQQNHHQQQPGLPQQQHMSVFPISRSSQYLPSSIDMKGEMEQQYQRHPSIFFHTYQDPCWGVKDHQVFRQTHQGHDLNVDASILPPVAMLNEQQLDKQQKQLILRLFSHAHREHHYKQHKQHTTYIENHEACYLPLDGRERRHNADENEDLRGAYRHWDIHSEEIYDDHLQPYLQRQLQQHEQEHGWSTSCWPPSTPWQGGQSQPIQQGEHGHSPSPIPHSTTKVGTGLFLLSMAAAQRK